MGADMTRRRSMKELERKGSGAIIEDTPRITSMFMILEPTTFPTAISGFPRLAAMIEVTSSGMLVPIATIVSPMILSETWNDRAISTAPSTRIFPPENKRTTASIIHRIDFQRGILRITSLLSSGIKLLCFTE